MSPERRSRPDEDYVQAVMQRFVRDFPDVVLIGGWATYIRTRIAKSHDIDIIVDHATLAKLGAKFQLSPSHHISGRKFELKVEGVGVDVYPVYQSKLGQRLQIPVEVLINHTEKIDRTRVLTTEAQFVAKMAALLDRLLAETADLSRHDRATLRLKRARALEAARSVEGRDQELER